MTNKINFDPLLLCHMIDEVKEYIPDHNAGVYLHTDTYTLHTSIPSILEKV